MAQNFEIDNPVYLVQHGRNYPTNNMYLLRQNILDIVINSDDLADNRRGDLVTFIQNTSDETIKELNYRIIYSIASAETFMWKSKLEEHINGNPPPEKYDADKGGRTPLQFLEDVWGEYMDHGVLYQDILSSYDAKLIPAIYNYWNRNPRLDSHRLPPPKQARTESIIQRIVAQGPDTLDDIMRAARALGRRDQRAR